VHDYDHRVEIDPYPIKAGGKVKIKYNGLLAGSGADKVYLHYGVDGWKKPQTIPMEKSGNYFETEVKITASVRHMDFCFKDCADHWDNNTGLNWTAEAQNAE
jgi:hypothetical protein